MSTASLSLVFHSPLSCRPLFFFPVFFSLVRSFSHLILCALQNHRPIGSSFTCFVLHIRKRGKQCHSITLPFTPAMCMRRVRITWNCKCQKGYQYQDSGREMGRNRLQLSSIIQDPFCFSGILSESVVRRKYGNHNHFDKDGASNGIAECAAIILANEFLLNVSYNIQGICSVLCDHQLGVLQ